MSSDLQNKMFHFEADPPKEVWNKIAGALDADNEQEFPQRLFNYEVQPPVNIWDKIEASLEEESAIKVIPITRYKKPLRYIAVAASIIAAFFLTTNLLNKKTGTGSVIGGTETVNTTNQSSILPLDNSGTQPGVAIVPKKTVSTTAAENDVTNDEKTVRRRSLVSIRPQNILSIASIKKGFIPAIASKEVLFDFSEMNNYMVYSDGKGNAMRVPKKLFSLLFCADGDYSCNERIRQLQQKMATSATTTDFGGILEILRQLQ
jgi:hypothetical protein